MEPLLWNRFLSLLASKQTNSLLSCSFREHSFIVLTRRKNTKSNAGKSLFPLSNKFYQNISIFREEPTSALAGFHEGSQSWWNWNLEMLVFVVGGKSGNLEKNPQCSARTNNKLNPQWQQGGIERGPHWWEARALITVPSLTFSFVVGSARIVVNPVLFVVFQRKLHWVQGTGTV